MTSTGERGAGYSELVPKSGNGERESVFFFFFNWDSPHARLNSHYKAWSYKKKSTKKDYRIEKICLERTYS